MGRKIKSIDLATLDSMSNSELNKIYKSVAKSADSKLRAIEKASQEKVIYKNLTSFAYKSAMKDLERLGLNRRFDVSGGTRSQKIARIVAAEKFRTAQTSVVTGYKKIAKDRAKTINKKYGVKVEWYNVDELFECKLFSKLSTKFGSRTTLKVISQIQDKSKEVKDYLAGQKDVIQFVPELADADIKKIIYKNKREVKSFINSKKTKK